jgi:hypothetical protein
MVVVFSSGMLFAQTPSPQKSDVHQDGILDQSDGALVQANFRRLVDEATAPVIARGTGR